MQFFDRRVYTLQCNWKVYVDNYLDGGYHVPHAHKGLSSVIEYTKYTIENFERACLQSSPLSSDSSSGSWVASTRQGRAFYLWIYPNFMLNAYEGVMDTNLVVPLAVDKCAVIFDYLLRGHLCRRRSTQPRKHRSQRKSSGRRHGHLRRSTERPGLPRLSRRPPLRPPRSRRTSFPPPAPRRPNQRRHQLRSRRRLNYAPTTTRFLLPCPTLLFSLFDSLRGGDFSRSLLARTSCFLF